MKKQKKPTLEQINSAFQKCLSFNTQIDLYDNVEVNERFFVGDQWHGIQANGMPTPTFNFLKQVVMFQVATIASDNMAMQASIMSSVLPTPDDELEQVADVISKQFANIMEQEKIAAKCRDYLRNAAVDGDGCIHFWFDPTQENGQMYKGEIKAEVLENTRVHFGNPNSRDVQSQPYIIISKREIADEVKYRAEELHEAGLNNVTDTDIIRPDNESYNNQYDAYTSDKVTVMTYYYKNRDTKTIWCVEATQQAIIREPYDTEYTMYPLVWLNWDFKHDCYHGQPMLNGLINNQKIFNQMYAMIALHMSLGTFPKMAYDKTRIPSWNGAPGMAIAVNGSVDGVAMPISGGQLDPQVPAILQTFATMTKSFLGASDAALGNGRADNTSAIVALQRAAIAPIELTKQAHYQCIEDMGRIWIDIMSAKYGVREVKVTPKLDEMGAQPLGMNVQLEPVKVGFDFSTLRDVRIAIKVDVGASSYWSEIATMQTLDNMLMNGLLTPAQYVERLPSGFMPKQAELLKELKAAVPAAGGAPDSGGNEMAAQLSTDIPIEGGGGNAALQRALNKEGV